MSKISVIVPIYNVENFLPRCIDSILAQTFADFELILVDDGSPDNCGIICDSYAKKDSRIKVIHQENGGLSAARNAGLDIMQGEYVTFIDSDDFINSDYLLTLYELCITHSAEISICSYIRTSSSAFTPNISENVLVQCGRNIIKMQYEHKDSITFITAWGKLYRSSLWDGIRFPILKYHEDEFTTYKLLYNSKNVAYTDAKLYYYYVNNNSIILGKFSTRNLDSLDAFAEKIEFFKALKDQELVKLSQFSLVNRAIYCYQRICNEKEIANKKELKQKALSYIDKDLKRLYFKSQNSKNKVWLCIFFFSPNLYSFIRNSLKIGL